ncbi:MAG: flagellar hook protein FlgE [Burkholderiales bacterium]|nr:flagellar hook protein FlgE [Burkholderiales bacterium]
MSFQQGLSGLNATSKSLEVIGNNIANASTYGAKSARAEFSDFYSAALNGSTASSAGIGTFLANISQQFTQGSITATDNPLDIAINGRGFFQVSDGVSPTKYSRNGQFKVDREGYIVNNGGLKLLGYEADLGTGQIQPGLAVPIKLPTGGIAPQATEAIDMQLNLDSTKAVTLPAAAPNIDFTDATTYNNATSLTVYDGKGSPVALTYYFQRSAANGSGTPPATADVWEVYVTANGKTVGGTDAAPTSVMTIPFVADGSKPTAVGLLPAGSTIDPVTNKLTIALPDPINAGPDSAGNQPLPLTGLTMTMDVTQFASPFGVTDLAQDGYSAGQLVSIGIEDNGIVTARYSNGQTKSAGQVEVATFRNVQGLQPLGDNVWAYTFASGDPVTGVPGEGNLGVLQAGALEESNIDLTGELVNMITAQRAYQANAQTIKTMDQALQTLVNLR